MSSLEKAKGAALAVPFFATIPAVNTAIAAYCVVNAGISAIRKEWGSAGGHTAVALAMVGAMFGTGGIPDLDQNALGEWFDVDDRRGFIGIAEQRLDFNV